MQNRYTIKAVLKGQSEEPVMMPPGDGHTGNAAALQATAPNGDRLSYDIASLSSAESFLFAEPVKASSTASLGSVSPSIYSFLEFPTGLITVVTDHGAFPLAALQQLMNDSISHA